MQLDIEDTILRLSFNPSSLYSSGFQTVDKPSPSRPLYFLEFGTLGLPRVRYPALVSDEFFHKAFRPWACPY